MKGKVKNGPVPSRAAGSPSKTKQAGPPPARLTDLCGVISQAEAERMIREIEEAFEQVDAE